MHVALDDVLQKLVEMSKNEKILNCTSHIWWKKFLVFVIFLLKMWYDLFNIKVPCYSKEPGESKTVHNFDQVYKGW